MPVQSINIYKTGIWVKVPSVFLACQNVCSSDRSYFNVYATHEQTRKPGEEQ